MLSTYSRLCPRHGPTPTPFRRGARPFLWCTTTTGEARVLVRTPCVWLHVQIGPGPDERVSSRTYARTHAQRPRSSTPARMDVKGKGKVAESAKPEDDLLPWYVKIHSLTTGSRSTVPRPWTTSCRISTLYRHVRTLCLTRSRKVCRGRSAPTPPFLWTSRYR